MDIRDLPFGGKLPPPIRVLSVSQIYYIIWCKVNDASRWYLEGNVNKQHAANSIIGACLRYGENAAYYGRELPQYRRPSDCSRSVLTQFFYDKILKLGLEADNVNISSETGIICRDHLEQQEDLYNE